MPGPLEGAPRRVELPVAVYDREAGPKVVAAPGFPVFIDGPSTRGGRDHVRIEVEEIPSLIDTLRKAQAVAVKPFIAPRRGSGE